MELTNNVIKNLIRLSLIFLVGFTACKEESGSGDEEKNDGPSAEVSMSVYESVANDIILPSYLDLKTKVAQLETDANAFTAKPSTTTLDQLKASFKEAYISVQYVASYDKFGPADENFGLQTYNIYPVETARVDDNAANGGYDLDSRTQFRAIGFPAIDYLLFGKGDGAATVTYFENTTNAKQLLNDYVAQIKEAVDATYNGWSATGDNYANYFISNTGNSVSSTLGFLVNGVNLALENARNQIREPAGLESTQGNTYPEAVQAYYSAYSLELNKASLHGVEMLYNGEKKDGTPSQGLATLLNSVDTKHGEQDLVTVTEQVFDEAQAAVDAVPETLAESIVNGASSVATAVQKIQAVIPYYKADMSSALSVQITYQSGDGD